MQHDAKSSRTLNTDHPVGCVDCGHEDRRTAFPLGMLDDVEIRECPVCGSFRVFSVAFARKRRRELGFAWGGPDRSPPAGVN